MADSTDVTAGTNATATQYNNLRKDVVLAQCVMGTETYGSTVTIDWSDKTKGKIRTITLAGNPQLAFTNAVVGHAMLIRFIQGGAGGYTPVWPGSPISIKWPGGSAPPMTTTVGKIDAFLLVCTATNTFDGYFAGFGLS